jgi:RHS repeat-associated protein
VQLLASVSPHFLNFPAGAKSVNRVTCECQSSLFKPCRIGWPFQSVLNNSATSRSIVADRKVEYFHKEISLANTSGPIWTNVAVSNAFTGGAVTNGGLAFPGSLQSLTYDADGNLTFDGIWTYSWNARNQLIEMTTTNISGITATNRLRLDFAYDSIGRRISKIVSTNSTGNSFVAQSTNYYIYDGWNLIASFNPANIVQQAFVWGLDLSGSFTNAGGIGGLVGVFTNGSSYFVCCDGNGNVTALTPAATGTMTARYEYSPFGELIRANGAIAKGNPFAFSTKFRDAESGLVYYGYRYYNPTLGRWIGRDPAPDQLLELYCFNHNAPTLAVDPNGKSPILIAMGIGAVFGGVIGAIENPNHWLGFTEGAAAGGMAPLLGFAAATGMTALVGEGIISTSVGAASAGASASYMRSVFDNVANAQSSPWVINNKQQAAMAVAGTFGIVAGAWIGQSAAARGVDVDDAVLDATLTLAGEAGVGVAEAFNAGAEATANAGAALFQQHANDLNGQ